MIAFPSIFRKRELTFTFAIPCRPSICRLSVICNFRAHYSAGGNFWQCSIWYLGHLLTFAENLTEIVSGEPIRREGGLGVNAREVAKYSNFGPIKVYISEMVQNRRL